MATINWLHCCLLDETRVRKTHWTKPYTVPFVLWQSIQLLKTLGMATFNAFSYSSLYFPLNLFGLHQPAQRVCCLWRLSHNYHYQHLANTMAKTTDGKSITDTERETYGTCFSGLSRVQQQSACQINTYKHNVQYV